MKVNEVDVVLIPSLPELMALPAGGGDVPIYNGADNILYRIKAALLGGGSETAVKWNVSTTYAADVVVEFGLKLWLSLADGNTGNTPVDGSAWWVEVSKSTANGFGYWAPGVFTVDPSMVLINGCLYYLDNSVVDFPFNSVDFTTELASGIWKNLGILTASEIVALLQSLAGDDRLDASAIKNLNTEAAVGGFASNVYFSALDSDLFGYKRQSSTVDPTETILTASVTASEGDKFVNQYIFDLPANITLIQQGNWSFTFASFVSSAAGDTRVGFRPFRYTSLGDKVYTFDAILWSKEIDILTTAEYLTAPLIQESKAIESTDRLGCDLYVKTTAATAKTVNIIIGGGQAMFMNVPIALRHSALRDLNGDSNYVHLTQTEKGGINKIDASGFNGNLTPADDTVQKVAQKFDDYVGGGGDSIYNGQFSFSCLDSFTIPYARAITLTSVIKSASINDLRIGKNGATPVTITFPYSIAANDLITFAATYDRESQAYFTLIGTKS